MRACLFDVAMGAALLMVAGVKFDGDDNKIEEVQEEVRKKEKDSKKA